MLALGAHRLNDLMYGVDDQVGPIELDKVPTAFCDDDLALGRAPCQVRIGGLTRGILVGWPLHLPAQQHEEWDVSTKRCRIERFGEVELVRGYLLVQRVASRGFQAAGVNLLLDLGGERLERLGDEPFPSASTIKLAILCTALEKNQKGEIGYFDTRVYEPADKRGGRPQIRLRTRST